MDRPIKILVHGMTANPGGTESCIMNYCRNIGLEEVHFDFLCFNEYPAYSKEITSRGGKIYCIHGRRKYFAHCRELKSIFKENKYDGIWSNRCDLSGTVLLFKVARKFGVPLRILHAHSTGVMSSSLRISRMFHEIDKYRIKKYVTDFWSCSEKASAFFFHKDVSRLPTHRIIKNAINANDFKFDGGVTRNNIRKVLGLDDKFVIGHIGHFSPVKNHAFLMQVFNEIYKKEPNSVLLLVGDGRLRSEIENMVKSLNLTKAVLFLGRRHDIPALLNAMDILVFPSKFEGLGIALIEAQAASLRSFASTEVPMEAKITDLLSFIDLKESPEEWAELILAKRDYKRIDMTEEICNAGYNIKTEAAKLEDYLLERARNLTSSANKR